MENMVLLGINTLLLMGLWLFCFKPAIRERKVEELLSLKRQIKLFFKKHYSLTHPMYLKLNEKVDCAVSQINTFTLSSYISWDLNIEKNPELKEMLHEEIAKEYATDDPAIADFVKYVRTKISIIGVKAVLTTSFYTLVIVVPIVMFFALKELVIKGRFKFRLEPQLAPKAIKVAYTEDTLFLQEKTC